MTGKRLIIGAVLMGLALPATLFFLLKLQTAAQFFTIAAAAFLLWGVADLLATILERPRLENRTPGRALRDDWERRRNEE